MSSPAVTGSYRQMTRPGEDMELTLVNERRGRYVCGPRGATLLRPLSLLRFDAILTAIDSRTQRSDQRLDIGRVVVDVGRHSQDGDAFR